MKFLNLNDIDGKVIKSLDSDGGYTNVLRFQCEEGEEEEVLVFSNCEGEYGTHLVSDSQHCLDSHDKYRLGLISYDESRVLAKAEEEEEEKYSKGKIIKFTYKLKKELRMGRSFNYGLS